jgi:hypothetical protein
MFVEITIIINLVLDQLPLLIYLHLFQMDMIIHIQHIYLQQIINYILQVKIIIINLEQVLLQLLNLGQKSRLMDYQVMLLKLLVHQDKETNQNKQLF